MKLDSKVDLKHLKVDGGMTNGDLAMQVLADVGGFGVVRPEMREFVVLCLWCDVISMNRDLSGLLPWARRFWQDLQLGIVAGTSTRLKHCLR